MTRPLLLTFVMGKVAASIDVSNYRRCSLIYALLIVELYNCSLMHGQFLDIGYILTLTLFYVFLLNFCHVTVLIFHSYRTSYYLINICVVVLFGPFRHNITLLKKKRINARKMALLLYFIMRVSIQTWIQH